MSGEVVFMREAQAKRLLAERAAARGRCRLALEAAAEAVADAVVEGEGALGPQAEQLLRSLLVDVEVALRMLQRPGGWS